MKPFFQAKFRSHAANTEDAIISLQFKRLFHALSTNDFHAFTAHVSKPDQPVLRSSRVQPIDSPSVNMGHLDGLWALPQPYEFLAGGLYESQRLAIWYKESRLETRWLEETLRRTEAKVLNLRVWIEAQRDRQ